MTEQIILTNLLYLRDEVKIALLISLLNKNESAIFWAYELHYSGLTQDLFDLLEKIYYYFFATLNPKFKNFLNRKILEWNEQKDIQVINAIVSNLLIRPFNLDIFILVHTCVSVKLPDSIDVSKWIEERKYSTIAKYILHSSNEAEFSKLSTSSSRIEYLAEIMQQCTEKKGIKSGHKLYLQSHYIGLEIGDKPILYKIMETHCKYGVNESELLGAFDIRRPKIYKKLQELWRINWLYYACGSPVWLERVESYKGSLNNEKKSVIFPSEDLEEAFYNNFDLEPDEQKRETQEKIIPEISDTKVEKFYKKFNNANGVYVVNEKILDKIKRFHI